MGSIDFVSRIDELQTASFIFDKLIDTIGDIRIFYLLSTSEWPKVVFVRRKRSLPFTFFSVAVGAQSVIHHQATSSSYILHQVAAASNWMRSFSFCHYLWH